MLDEVKRKEICEILSKVLANTYSVFLKTQNFHWNVTGKEFYSLHIMFEKQYEELFEAIDEIAERVRSLGGHPEGSFEAFAKLADIQGEKQILSAPEMMKQLLRDHETHICHMRKHLPFVEEAEDGATADMLNKRLAIHEKTAWMLRSSLWAFFSTEAMRKKQD